MIFSKLTLGLGAAAGVMAVVALWQGARAELHKERADQLEETNETLTLNLEAIAAADSAVERRSAELERAATAAAKALREARMNDETLDQCWLHNPNVDVTGGLLENGGNPSTP